jgi:hypothetical protein
VNDVLYATNLFIYGLNKIITPFANAINDMIKGFKQATDFIDNLINTIKRGLEEAVNKIKDFFSGKIKI